jgi:hypothetical protein
MIGENLGFDAIESLSLAVTAAHSQFERLNPVDLGAIR